MRCAIICLPWLVSLMVVVPLALAGTENGSVLPAPASVDLKIVKYGQLVEAVRALRGKVVVVDVWATYCLPCKQEFPNLVRLYHDHAKDGLACLSVSVDEPARRDGALTFLRAKGAAFSNFLLDETGATWQGRWGINSIPVVFVFDRDGKRAAKFHSDDPDHSFTYADVRKLVERLLVSRS
jgi:thiol-disulfide isomerase/thioredoxin